MASVTYKDLEDAAPKVQFHGVDFEKDKAVETDNAALIEAARANPYFEVSGGDEKEANPDSLSPFARGEQAARDEKPRSVPVAYRGKVSGDEWLSGYDNVANKG